jgi:hypothetical protein
MKLPSNDRSALSDDDALMLKNRDAEIDISPDLREIIQSTA